jgi:hypothetical protein
MTNKIDFDSSRNLIEELTESILEQRIGDFQGVGNVMEKVKQLNTMLQAHEKTLSRLESSGNGDSEHVKLMEKWEKELLEQFKQHDRLLQMVNMNNVENQSTAHSQLSNMARQVYLKILLLLFHIGTSCRL